MMCGGAVAARLAHNQKAGGSNPPRATEGFFHIDIELVVKQGLVPRIVRLEGCKVY